MTVIDEANRVLGTFNHRTHFVRLNRLCLTKLRGGFVGAQVAKNSGALCINYGRLGMGGTEAMAVGQLARWIRGQTRVPLAAWVYWADQKVMLAGERGNELIDLLEQSTYDDGKSTRCVLCGADRCGDWWCLDGVVGPCCTYGCCVADGAPKGGRR